MKRFIYLFIYHSVYESNVIWFEKEKKWFKIHAIKLCVRCERVCDHMATNSWVVSGLKSKSLPAIKYLYLWDVKNACFLYICRIRIVRNWWERMNSLLLQSYRPKNTVQLFCISPVISDWQNIAFLLNTALQCQRHLTASLDNRIWSKC